MLEPEDNNDVNSQQETNTEETSERTNDVLDFIDIVNTVVFYYTTSSMSEDLDSSETWKAKANLIKKVVPEEVDDMVKQAFVKQLKKYI